MIKNERQYRITKSQADKFASALADIADENGSQLAALEANALRSQLSNLQNELREYDDLRSGHRSVLTVESFDRLPQALVQARIAMGLSQKELADRLNMKEQQIQRYESTNFQSASMSRLQEIVEALGITVRKEVFLPPNRTSMPALFDRLQSAGVEQDLLVRRILPPAIAERIASKTWNHSDVDICQVASRVGRVFGWGTDELFRNDALRLPTEASGIARFKIPAGVDQRKVSAYTVYAHYLSLLVLQATPDLQPHAIPNEADDLRYALVSRYGDLTFASVLRFAWDLGVPVLPLNDGGAFHGAFWRVGGRNIVVLKQRTMSQARWINDCLHELYHAGQEANEPERSVIEASETSAERRNSDEEQEATTFAGDVALDGRADELAQMCVHAAGGRIPRLKAVVPMVAANEGVDTGCLANYLAFRLSLQDVDWWGTATNLQLNDDSPWETARGWLIPHLDLDRLCEPDRQILMQALSS